MQKTKKRIEIVSSLDPKLSSMGAESRSAIYNVLIRHYSNVTITIITNPADLESLANRQPDLVFLGMKFIPLNSELGINDPAKIWISDYLDQQGIAYTGSDQNAHELELNKQLAKQRVLDRGLESANYAVISRNQASVTVPLGLEFPLFVKPANRGGGLGINSNSLVFTTQELQDRLDAITKLQSDSLVEEYLPGREFSVAILKDINSSALSVMPIELVAEPDDRGARILGGAVKSSNTERVLAVTDKKVRAAVCLLASNVFYSLGARDYGRIDIRLNKAGVPSFLEANLLPSLISGYGSFPKACELNNAINYETMILSIVQLGLARSLRVTENTIVTEGSLGILMPVYS